MTGSPAAHDPRRVLPDPTGANTATDSDTPLYYETAADLTARQHHHLDAARQPENPATRSGGASNTPDAPNPWFTPLGDTGNAPDADEADEADAADAPIQRSWTGFAVRNSRTGAVWVAGVVPGDVLNSPDLQQFTSRVRAATVIDADRALRALLDPPTNTGNAGGVEQPAETNEHSPPGRTQADGDEHTH